MTPKVEGNDKRPACESPWRWRCKCPLADRQCGNGHEYHVCLKCRRFTPGKADHAIGTDDSRHWCPECRRADSLEIAT